MQFNIIAKWMISAALAACLCACNKLVTVPEPVNSITTSEAFGTDVNAISGLLGIYNSMNNFNTVRFANGLTTIDAAMSADELKTVNSPAFQDNNILSTDGDISSGFWSAAYYDIYMANAVLEGLQASTGVTPAVKNQVSGEAKFLRAYCYFYLVNLFGDVPLALSTDWASNNPMPRTPVSKVYEQIFADLKDAQSLLVDDYSYSGGEKIRANKWAATALLARVYLYNSDWKNAEAQASVVINSGVYQLSDLDKVFLKNSDESILQLQVVDGGNYSTQEAYTFIPAFLTSDYPQDVIDGAPWAFLPAYYLTDQLKSAFEAGDNRLTNYVTATAPIQGVVYYYPHKYKVRVGQPGNITEYYTFLRLSEQYLIRAEARAQQGTDLTSAIGDLNIIRERAGLPDLDPSLQGDQVLAAVAQERRIELLAEWGHRWLDLKRTGQADAVLAPIKPMWKPSAVLYPIPLNEFKTDPNLEQNPGYF